MRGRFWCAIAVALVCALQDRAAGRQDVSDWSRNRWHAQLITTSDKPLKYYVRDHATQAYGDAWDFDEGDTEGIDEFGNGLEALEVKDGALKFRTGEIGNYFFWGDYNRDKPAYGAEKIQAASARGAIRNWWGSRYLRVRIKQSLPVSSWVISTGAKAGEFMHRFRLKGIGWQTIVVRLPDSKTLWSICLETAEPGNEVAIDWIRIEAVVPRWYFRKIFELSETPTSASVVLLCAPAYAFYVNGKLVKSAEHASMRTYERIDFGGLLKAGMNSLAVMIEGEPVFSRTATGLLAVEGAACFANGSCERIFTDQSWRATSTAVKDWQSIDFNDVEWPKAVSKGAMASSPFGYLPDKDSWGFFIGPPYFGPIALKLTDREEPVYTAGEHAAIEISVPAPPPVPEGQKPLRQELLFEVLDAASGRRVADGSLRRPELKGRKNVYMFDRRLRGGGAEFIHFTLKDHAGRTVDDRYYEIVVAGPIKQRKTVGNSFTHGLDLAEVDVIDCSKSDEPARFSDGPYVSQSWLQSAGATGAERRKRLAGRGSSSLIKTALGVFRITGNAPFDWFGYSLRVKRPGRPHVLVLEYPDDTDRAAHVAVLEKHGLRGLSNDPTGNLGQARAAAGIRTGQGYPNTNRRQLLHLLFWPISETPTVVVSKGHAPRPAAISRIWLYEVRNELPVMARARGNDRLFALHVAHGDLLPLGYHAGPTGLQFAKNLWRTRYLGFYRDWYGTVANLIKHMRFLGYNAYIGGVYQGNRAYYPSAVGAPEGWHERLLVPSADFWELTARMFDENHLKLILNIEFEETPALRMQDVYSDYEVRSMAAPTLRQVSKAGVQSDARQGGFNVFAPLYEQELLRVVDELCDRYARCPGILGIGQRVGAGAGLNIACDARGRDDILSWGYGDATAAAFSADTGIQVAVHSKDPKRFAKRHKWLLQKRRKEWVRWRNDRIVRLHLAARDRTRKANRGWRYFVFAGNLPPRNWTAYVEGTRSVQDILREAGQDPTPLKAQDGVVLVSMFQDDRSLLAVRPDDYWAARTVYTGPELLGLYDNHKNTGIYPRIQGYAPWISAIDDWHLDRFVAAGYPVAAGRNAQDRFGIALAKRTPWIMPNARCETAPFGGNGQSFREAACVLRAIPDGEYRTLRDNGLDKNIVVRVCDEHRRRKYFYVVNRLWGAMHVSLAISDCSGVTDLVNDSRIRVGNGRLDFDLAPYQTRVFSAARSSEVLAAGVHCPDAGDWAYRGLANWRLVRACLIESDIPDDDPKIEALIRKFRTQFDKLETAFEDGDYAQTWELMHDQRYRRVYNALTQAFVGQDWLIIGPFDNTGGKGFNTVFPVERDHLNRKRLARYKLRNGRPGTWREMTAVPRDGALGYIDFEEAFDYADWSVGYAYTRIYSKKGQNLVLMFGADDRAKVWINRNLVQTSSPTGQARPGQNRVDIRLHADWNEVLVKVEDKTETCEMFFDIVADNGKRVWDLKFQPQHKTRRRRRFRLTK